MGNLLPALICTTKIKTFKLLIWISSPLKQITILVVFLYEESENIGLNIETILFLGRGVGCYRFVWWMLGPAIKTAFL